MPKICTRSPINWPIAVATKSKSLEQARLRLAAEQRADFLACRDSETGPITFAKRHATIETVQGRAFRPKFWPKQIEVLEALHRDRKVVVLKARRMGLSWLVLIYALWCAIFQQGIRILILCKNEGDAAVLLDRVRRMLDRIRNDPLSRHLLTDLKEPASGKVAKDAVTTLQIGTSVIRALPAKAKAARLETAGLVILDEFAFAQEASDIWRAILPTTEAEDDGDLDFVDDTPPVLEGDGALAVISTGNGETGTGEEFYKQWDNAESGSSGFTPVFLSWRDRPDRDDEWAERMREAMGDDERFQVEYPETPQQAFQRPDATLVFESSHIAAAQRLGAQFDAKIEEGTMPDPVGGALYLGIDYGDFATVGLVIWELERGGLYVPPQEFTSSRVDLEKITEGLLAMAAKYPYWLAAARYDASFAQSNRTFAANAEKLLGPHNSMAKTGRPATVPVKFNVAKDPSVRYLRLLMRRASDGEATRVLAISPTNKTLIRQLKAYEYKDSDPSKFEKGDDDAVDALIAGTYPVAKAHRAEADNMAEAE